MATEETAAEIELPETETEESGAEGAEPATASEADGEAKKSRKERRQEWYANQQREREELKSELQRERQARQQFEVQMAEMRGRLEAMPQQQQEDPHEKRVAELLERAERHLGDGSTAKTPEAARESLRQYHATMREVSRLEAQKLVASERETWSQGQMDPGTQATAMRLASEFDWLRSRTGARALADEYIHDMVTKEGMPNSYETYRAACARVAKELGLGGAANGANGNGQRYTLPAAKNGAGGGDVDPPMKLTPDEEKIAEHWGNRYHPNLSEEGVYKMWWNAIGKKARLAQRRR